MTPWAGALVWSTLLGITSGHDLRFSPRLINESFISERASVSAGPCLSSPAIITIPAGKYADFRTSIDYRDYGAFEQCSWNFKTDTSAQLWLSCDFIQLSWLASLYVIVRGRKYTKTCAPCAVFETFQFMIRSNTATVGLQNNFWFTDKGFSCRILSVLKPNNTGCNCGVIQSQRVVGGQETAPNQYPWMALLYSPYTYADYFGGGSLITDEFVLTSARSTLHLSASEIQVELGIHVRYTTPVGYLLRDVLEIITHPQYDNYGNYEASLLRISAVDFASHPKIRPICLPTGSNTYAGQQAITAGWGNTEDGGSDSPVLMAVTVPVISNSKCNCSGRYKIVNSMICAGNAELHASNGDTGSPLFLSEGSGYQVIIGIMSLPTECASPRYHRVYTRTTEVKCWIVSKLDGSTVCSPP